MFLADESYFKDGISILALCAKSFKKLVIYACQLMNNHFHFVVSCPEDEAHAFTETLIKTLGKYLSNRKDGLSIKGLKFKFIPISTPDQLRNTIAYVNRNGFVAHSSYTPFNYPWGTSAYYFSFDSHKRYKEQKTLMGQIAKRRLTCSHKFDKISELYLVDGYVSPLCFCNIQGGEEIFINAKQYFYSMVKNQETNADIARAIGESLFYTDEDLFSIARKIATEKFRESKISQLVPEARIDLAKELHFKYNAGVKQLQRILKLDRTTLKSLFPQSSI